MQLKILVVFLVFVISSCSTIPKYDRPKDWGGWRTTKCKNTRTQVLIEQSIPPIKLKENGCKVNAGTWIDFYSGQKITMDDKPTIDHVVPVKQAHNWGGYKWNKEKRVKFYNDKSNLVVTSKSMNSQKGDRDFITWHPMNWERACLYATKWIYVKKKYNFKFSKEECQNFQALEEAKPCPNPLNSLFLAKKT